MYQAPTQVRPQAGPIAAQPAAPEIPLPPEPQTLEQTGLTLGFLSDLALKTLYLRGQMTMAEIASSLGLPMQNITEVLATLMRGDVVLPYAVEVDQQVVKVYDQVYHRVALDPVVAERLRFDHRWVVSKRPIVMTGGELTLETLDLIYDETSKFYEAPFQMKANGGIFMVDDFGRQRV